MNTIFYRRRCSTKTKGRMKVHLLSAIRAARHETRRTWPAWSCATCVSMST